MSGSAMSDGGRGCRGIAALHSYLRFVLMNGRFQFSDGRHVCQIDFVGIDSDARHRNFFFFFFVAGHFTQVANVHFDRFLFDVVHHSRHTSMHNGNSGRSIKVTRNGKGKQIDERNFDRWCVKNFRLTFRDNTHANDADGTSS